ncbi:MAG: helix-turn-helix domain-containing protein [Candidatus Marinimicrobia bacterium]|nr:helix-turn-helix domain-containing protein [Candidatus Neomarinimicrobiota bacterium]
MIVEALLKQLINEMQELKNTLAGTTLPWLDIKEASSYLKLSVSTIRKLTSKGEIPFKHLGEGQKSKVLFSRKQLDMWIMTGKTSGFTKRDKETLDVYL